MGKSAQNNMCIQREARTDYTHKTSAFVEGQGHNYLSCSIKRFQQTR